MGSDEQGFGLRGPDDVELLIARYDDGYVWRIRNGPKNLENVRFEFVSLQSFDAPTATFITATTEFRAYWQTIRKLSFRERTKNTILVAFEGDHVRLGRTTRMNRLPWPSGDPSLERRWILKMKIAGLSQEWPIDLDLRWNWHENS